MLLPIIPPLANAVAAYTAALRMCVHVSWTVHLLVRAVWAGRALPATAEAVWPSAAASGSPGGLPAAGAGSNRTAV